MCLPIFSSWFGTPVEENKRLIKVKCYSKEGIVNFYMKPVEGFSALVDMHKKEVRDPDSSKLRSVMYKGFTSELFVPYMDPIEVTEVRPKVTLVVRMATSLVNYNYIMDWEFQTDRPIKAKVSDEN
ncbi:Primary amine oxidase [Glycine soja]